MTVGFEVTAENWHEAMGPVDGIASAAEAAGRGDWVEAGLQGALGGLETLAAVTDPLGTLVSAGVGFIIEHFHPLTDWMDELAGNPDQIEVFADKWGTLGGQIHDNADDFRSAIAADTAQWSGPAIIAYKGATTLQAGVIDGYGVMVQGVGEAVRVGGAIVAMVRGMVREAIADLVGMAVSKTFELLSVVLAPKAIANIVTKVSEWVGKLTKFVKGLVRSMGKFGDLLTTIAEGLSKAGTKISSIAKSYDDLAMNKGLSIEASGIKIPTASALTKDLISNVATTEAARNNE